MPPNPRSDDPDGTVVHPAFLALVDRFDQMLAAGDVPKIVDVLDELRVTDPENRLRRACLLELVAHQQFHDWKGKKAQRVRWEHYIEQWPELRGWPEAEQRLRQQQQECEEQLKKSVPPPSPPASRPAQEWQKKFKNIAEVGHGGFGTVYSANYKRNGQLVAIKTVDEFEIGQLVAKIGAVKAAKLLQEKKESLVKEVKSLRDFRHDNIVPMLDFDFPQEPGQDWYVVYSFVDGGTLRKTLDELGPIDPAIACEITIKLARALHCAHQRNLIHQDIKPENILLDAKGEPYLIDFGLATSQDEILRGKSPGGTRWYLSKEQVEGKHHKISNRTDIYSLGVVLYEMLAGKRPLDAPNGDWQKAICEQVPVSLWVINPNGPSDLRVRKQLDAICDHALKKEPEARIANADYMAEQLEEVLQLIRKKPPKPAPPPPPPPKSRWRQLVATMVLVAAVATVAFLWLTPASPLSKSLLAAEFGTKQISVYHTTASGGGQRIIWPMFDADGKAILPPEADANSSVLGIAWKEPDFSVEEPPWFAQLNDFEHRLPSSLPRGTQLVLLNQSVFRQPNGQTPPADCFSEVFVAQQHQGSEIDVHASTADVAIGSPVFASEPRSLMGQLWNEHGPKTFTKSTDVAFHIVGVVVEARESEGAPTTLVVKSVRDVADEARRGLPLKPPAALPKLTSSKPAIGTEITVRQTTAVRLNFDIEIKAGAAFKPLVANNGHVKVLEIEDANSRWVEIELTPESVGKVVVELPTGFVTTQSGVESKAETLNFIAKADFPPPNWIDSSPDPGTEVVAEGTTKVRLWFEGEIQEGSAFGKVQAQNASIGRPVRIGQANPNPGIVQLDVTPLAVGTISLQVPADFVKNANQVGNKPVTIKFQAVDRTPPQIIDLKLQPESDDRKKRSFEVTFSKPVMPRTDNPLSWFERSGPASVGAEVLLKESWTTPRAKFRADVIAKQDGELILKIKNDAFEASGYSIQPRPDPDIDADARKIRIPFDWTPPKLVVDPFPKFMPLGEVLTVHAFSEKKERLKLRRSAIAVPPTASIEQDPADGHEDFEFNIGIRPRFVGRFEVAIKEGLIADIAGNASSVAFKRELIVVPNFGWANNLEKQVLQKLKVEDESGLKILYEQINEELRDVPVAEIPWPLRMLRASIAFELATDQMPNANVNPQRDWLSLAREEFRDVAQKWPLNNPKGEFGDSAFLVWMMVARADELQAEFGQKDLRTKLRAVEQSLVDLEKRISLTNPSRNRAIWFHERWHCAAIETSLLEESVRGRVLTPMQKTDFEKELQNQYQRMVQFLMESYQSFATESGEKNLKHYLMPTQRSKIGPEMATQIEQILRAKPQARSPFDHISRFVEAYRQEFLSNAEMK